ncbi:MAG: hypothetical protein AB9880_03675 [Christensenellales bacterium]
MKFDKQAFKTWLEENLKDDGKGDIWLTHNFDAYCDDLEKSYREIGQPRYELKRYETASGNPEEFTYEHEEDDE